MATGRWDMIDAEARNEELEWTAHPARDSIVKTVVALLVIALAGMAVWFSFGSLSWCLFSVVVLLLALNRYFFPSRYRIDREGISASYFFSNRRLTWDTIRYFASDDRGAFLSTRARPGRWDIHRGLHLYFGAERETVVAAIKRHLEPQP